MTNMLDWINDCVCLGECRCRAYIGWRLSQVTGYARVVSPAGVP